MKNVLVTGASTGIGYSSVQNLISSGYRVFGSLRNKSDADKLSEEFGDNFIPLLFDVRDEDAIKDAFQKVTDSIGNEGYLHALVNNSGIALGGPLQYLPTDIFRKQFEVNVFGVVTVTRTFLPLLGTKRGSKNKGKIVMIK